MSKLMYKSSQAHISMRSGIFYFVGRIPVQDLDVPSIEIVRAGGADQPNCGFQLTDALDLYLRLKGDGRDRCLYGQRAATSVM